MIYLTVYLVVCLICLGIVVWKETETRNIEVATLLAMIFVCSFPFVNIIVASSILGFDISLKPFERVLDITVFKSRK